MRDYSELLKNALTDCDAAAQGYTFVGLDESANRPELHKLLTHLVESGAIRNYGALWTERRERSDGGIVHVYGGVSSRNREGLRVTTGDLGKVIPHTSDKDTDILDLLVTHFLSFGRVVLISEDISNKVSGLRQPLRDVFKPLLETVTNKELCLVGLFKKGKTDPVHFREAVEEFLCSQEFQPGYTEILI